MAEMNRFHCCATCQHFRVSKGENGVKTTYSCSRLGFETQSSYRFDCWQPTERVRRLVEKENLPL
ncbi:hypothetical protein EEL32_12445 [Brevibacillus laterosporus]|uniref:Uncharacterized protein n=1 Tax=Brevibacillus laterosporus TaxID=1465 RepID=A0A502IJ55_BRELA|nr:hypothetical protein [Brevibacillus laterosporus]QDX93204.1 hypothetical protein EEL30_13380 [Brevibacillus laterosporus]RAP27002.1 hypothetical protein C2W64_01147 [Brevibacillus laterosporus]TPG72944.1 hypothetical protein EEL31_00710 [Brevibacillus laterosporus]TPG86901.1 hypothetical protein EEL32_12445 [Brevibacillus laterosporus]